MGCKVDSQLHDDDAIEEKREKKKQNKARMKVKYPCFWSKKALSMASMKHLKVQVRITMPDPPKRNDEPLLLPRRFDNHG
jgi:hypothetical protein